MTKNFTFILLLVLPFLYSQAQDPQGFFLDDWQPKTAVSPQYINTPQAVDPATVTVTVNCNDKITKVPKYIYGNNAVNWGGKMNTKSALIKNIKNLQPNILRWPGGNLSNQHFWDAVQNQGPTDIPPTMEINPLNAGMNTTNWAMTLDEYYDMLVKTNSSGCICINYSYARYGTSVDPVANAAHYAANWVRYDNGRTKFWEIGNENFGPWQAGYEIDTSLNQDGQPKLISGELYGQHSRVFIDSMKSAAAEIGSDIKIGVNVMDELVTYNTVMNEWNRKIMPQIADKADFLIVHSYYTPYNQNSSVATILNSPTRTKDFKEYILGDLKTHGNKENLPLALTEWNIFAVGSKQAVSFINGIHATLVLGEVIKNKYGQANRWDLANGWNNGDDHGLFSRSGEPGVTEYTPHAPFYYMYYFQKYFGDQMVSSTVAGSSVIVSYASSFSSGECGVVLVNKHTSKKVVNLKIENLPNAKSYYRYVLTGGTDNGDFSRKVFVNGHGTTLEGGGPANYETIEAFGKSINGDIIIELPPLSVTYVLVTGDLIPPLTALNMHKKQTFNIYPNPAKKYITIRSSGFKFEKIEILNSIGSKVFGKVLDQPNETTELSFDLNEGLYILNLKNGRQQISKKLIIN